MTVVSVLRLAVRPGAESELADAYERLGIFDLARESGGFLGGRLLRQVSDGASFLVVAEWEAAEDYERWLESPARAGLTEHLEPLLGGELDAAVYEEVVRG